VDCADTMHDVLLSCRTRSTTTTLPSVIAVASLHADGYIEDLDQPASAPVAAEPAVGKQPATEPSVQTEDELREAIKRIVPVPRTPEWWQDVGRLYHTFKRVEPKYPYRKLAEILTMDEKYVGNRIRQHHPKSP
jgi:hypothetical protein